MSATVVGRRRERNELGSRKSVNAVLAVLVRPDDDAEVVGLQEFLNLVRSVNHDVVLLLGVSLRVGLQPENVFVL